MIDAASLAGGFADRERHVRAQRRGFDGASTIEIGHASSRVGFILRVDRTPGGATVRTILERAFDVAGEMPHRRVTSPGWWAIIVGIAASEFAPTEMMRVPERASRHAVVVVARGRGLIDGNQADWPMVRTAPTSPFWDLRGEAALRHGPCMAELASYGDEVGMSMADVLRAFEVGVLEFRAGPVQPGRRRGLQRAGA